MRKLGLSFVACMAFAWAIPCSAYPAEECVKEDTACTMPSTAFCLSEKIKTDPTFFLSDEAKKDIGITEEQDKKIRELVKTTCEAIEKEKKDLKCPTKNSTKEEVDAYRKEMKQICEKHYPMVKEKLESILNKEQVSQLQTRMFQYYGFTPCPIALSVLNLSAEQKKKVEQIGEEMCNTVFTTVKNYEKGDSQDQEQLRDAMEQCRLDCAAKVKKILTSDQLALGTKLLNQVPAYVKKMKESHHFIKTALKPSEIVR